MVKSMIKIGDYVTRKSYGNDIVFKVDDIDESICYLSGVDYRLIADSMIGDLVVCDYYKNEDREYINKLKENTLLDRDEYFYIPGKILHIDSDKDYLKRCMDFYKESGVPANGITLNESEVPKKISKLLENVNPDILVVTGHDAYYKNSKEKDKYKNSKYFIECVKEARKLAINNPKLVIIAGACQSNYEALIKSGATFASSPKRINIHALDPAIIASSISLSKRGKMIDLIDILNKTKYGKDGIGGIITEGTMEVGYPRG